ncbi:MAG: hypothetical protein KF690_08945 [Bacteroidetes bacterium]|nr:hypothetical protein [Bacteroidota bacterium]
MRIVVFVLLLLGRVGDLWAQSSVSQSSLAFSRGHAGKVAYTELGKTREGVPVYVLTLGTGNADDKPAVCVVAGTRQDYAYTASLALELAKSWVQDEALLSRYTLYIIPEASPDELSRKAGTHQSRNTTPFDEDLDARTDEDPADDLNGDGRITYMRYADPAGPWAEHPADPRILVPWQQVLETGTVPVIRYQLLPEGRDNDGDGRYNEDGVGGTAFEQNWPWNYQWFAPGSGSHPVSEPETRAVADFLFARKNIYAVLVLGPHSNLTEAWKETLGDPKLPQSKLGAADFKTYQLLAQQFGKRTGIPHVAAEERPGFLHWVHFHYGRWALGSPGWRPAYPARNDGLTNTLRSPEYQYVQWRDSLHLPVPFDPWKPFKVGKLPAAEVEIGGLRVMELWAPPADTLPAVAGRHKEYLRWVAGMFPTLDVKPELTQLDKDLWQLTLKVSNIGALPTHTEWGANHPYTQAVVCELETGNTLVAGLRLTKLPVLAPGAQHTLKFVLKGTAPVSYKVHSPHTGAQMLTLPLK